MDVVDEHRSIIIAVSRGYRRSPYPISLIRLETPPPQELVEPLPLPLTLPTSRLDGNKFFAHVPHLLPLVQFCLRSGTWGFPLPTTTSPEKLYMFSDLYYHRPLSEISEHRPLSDISGHRPLRRTSEICSLPGISFDLSTKTPLTIIPSPMNFDLVVYLPATVGDSIFFLIEPLSFTCYNTLSGSWYYLNPPQKHLHHQQFSGTAVLKDDIILFNMVKKPLAYVISENKWYPVNDPGQLCSNILGQAVVVNNIIYALNDYILLIFALNRNRKSFTCDLLGEHVYDVPSIEKFTSYENLHMELVHLGKDNFCVVHNWDLDAVSPDDRQYIQLTYITLSQKELIVKGIRLHGFEIPPGDYFILRHCFSLPNSKFNALEEGTTREQEADFVILPPDLVQFVEKNSSKSTFILGAEDNEDYEAEDTTPKVHEDFSKKPSPSVVAPKSNVPTIARTMSAVTVTEASTHGDVVVSGKKDSHEEKGHYICVSNLPLQLRLDELTKELKKFGPFEFVSIHPDHSQMSNSCVIEFESATSKQNAIKGSPITIGGLKSVIEESVIVDSVTVDISERSLTQCSVCYSDWTSCSCSSSSKVKNHSEDSRYKTTSGGHKAEKKLRKRRSSKGAWK